MLFDSTMKKNDGIQAAMPTTSSSAAASTTTNKTERTTATVNRIPPSTVKRRRSVGSAVTKGSSGGVSNSSTSSCGKGAGSAHKNHRGDAAKRHNKKHKPKPRNLDLDNNNNDKVAMTMEVAPVVGEAVPKLDASDPVQARRLQQRRKDVLKGKNTVGYTEYIKQVPEHKRRHRCMETPSTPDPSLDISNKRWQGQIRAWRVALHKYDPPDLMSSFTEAAASAASSMQEQPTTIVPMSVETPSRPSQAKQLEEAAARGLLVDLQGAANANVDGTPSSTRMDSVKDASPISVLSVGTPLSDRNKSIDAWDIKDVSGDIEDHAGEDSDDDLL